MPTDEAALQRALRLRQVEQTLFGPDAATQRLPPALRRQLASALSDHQADFRARARPTDQSPRRLHRRRPTL